VRSFSRDEFQDGLFRRIWWWNTNDINVLCIWVSHEVRNLGVRRQSRFQYPLGLQARGSTLASEISLSRRLIPGLLATASKDGWWATSGNLQASTAKPDIHPRTPNSLVSIEPL